MNRTELLQSLLAVIGPETNPQMEIANAKRQLQDAEYALRHIEDVLESFNAEAIYKTGWGECGDKYWTKCETRKTGKSYLVSIDRQSKPRRFTREAVETDNVRSRWWEGFHLGRFIHDELLLEHTNRRDNLNRCRGNLQIVENQVAEGRPVVGQFESVIAEHLDTLLSLQPESSDLEEVDWKREGF